MSPAVLVSPSANDPLYLYKVFPAQLNDLIFCSAAVNNMPVLGVPDDEIEAWIPVYKGLQTFDTGCKAVETKEHDNKLSALLHFL